ncbi:hypothetical protein OUZ56_000904 [Daphnia magna]|uniref:RING-type E3 ubiquitin transferase n=1 Tax=Daphnia magna TaxID=35525 RepID=A0ABR0A1Q4_9CRUS|nr:hypothetical protein OUZ56_000904 [Daphnia magna]
MAKNDVSTTRDGTSRPDYDDGQCAICLEPHLNKSHLNCGHVFCFHCLVEWCTIKLQCPTCKQLFTMFSHKVGSSDDLQTYTPSPPLNPDVVRPPVNYLELFALMLGDHEFRSRLNNPQVIRQVEDFRRVLSDPEVIQALDDPAFRSTLNNSQFGATFEDRQVQRIMNDRAFRRLLDEMLAEILDDDEFLFTLSYPELRRSFFASWARELNIFSSETAHPTPVLAYTSNTTQSRE